MKYRKHLVAAAAKNAHLQSDLWTACKRDLLFYINAFCWVFEPRDTMVLPFVTWEFQDEALLAIDAAIRDQHDLLIEKSRDMGASYMVLAVMEWRWHFHSNNSFLLGSRKEELVDKPGDPKTLFAKIDFQHTNQPSWLLPAMTRQRMHLRNNSGGGTIDGESTNPDFGRGDRRTAVLLDEYASVEDSYAVKSAAAGAANCLIMNSTPKGTNNAFYDTAHDNSTRKVRLHWTSHPAKRKGLYRDEQGKPRSPWYDLTAKRLGVKMLVAQELDINYSGSAFQYFDESVIDGLIARDARPPVVEGDLEIPATTYEPEGFKPFANGPLQLWVNLDPLTGQPPRAFDYVIGADIASGTGASNSCLTVACKQTGEKVASYVNPKIRPEQLAVAAVGLARWFKGREDRGAFLIWEATGPGRQFGDRVIQLGYRNVFFRRDEQGLMKKSSDVPGWWPTPENKKAVLSKYREALGTTFINRCRDALKECLQYVYIPGTDTIEHSRASKNIDPSGARSNHGDRVTADALCVKGMEDAGPAAQPKVEDEPPVGSFAWRRKERESARRREQKTVWA